MLALAACTAIVLIRALLLHRLLARHERLRLRHAGLLSCELRRKARLVAHRDGSGVKTFPLPQETRTLVWRCAGVPLRTQTQSVGLPNQVADSIDTVDAPHFDGLFSVDFRSSQRAPSRASLAQASPVR
jgi:hypothetical protein